MARTRIDREFFVAYIIAVALHLIFTVNSKAINVSRFELFDTTRGLSQNSVSAILADSKGFLWVGTNNGLNRFDGTNFRVFMHQNEGQVNFTHNRIVKIWEDNKGFIWFETHDGHCHYFNPMTEQFYSIPGLLEDVQEGHSPFTDFLQYSDSEIWLGLRNQGVLRLQHSPQENSYSKTQYTSRGRGSLSNDRVSFVNKDSNGNLWIGTAKGLNFLPVTEINANFVDFDNLFVTHSFTAFIETATEIWFGTSDAGIIVFNKQHQTFSSITSENTRSLNSNNITNLHVAKNGLVLASFQNNGLQAFNPRQQVWITIPLHGQEVTYIYEDRFGKAWVTTENFGITRVNINTLETAYFNFLQKDAKVVPDAERHVFFEDSRNNLWIGTHEGALNFYDRESAMFKNFSNNPDNPGSISSNVVTSIAEDHSGQLWVGTGHFQGGLERVILADMAFEHIRPVADVQHISENVVRALFQDYRNRFWIGTKAGALHVIENGITTLVFNEFNTTHARLAGVNIYAIMVDKSGYLWLGSKGHGLFVSQLPLENYTRLENLTFRNYQPVANDSTSLSHVNVYSMVQDKSGNIWIGTYGNGLNRVLLNPNGSLSFQRFTNENSGLSSNRVRHLMVDSQNRLWIATGYGLNLMDTIPLAGLKAGIRSFFTGNYQGSLSMNDIVHLFEDSSRRVWAATFGGGVNLVEQISPEQITFKHFTYADGLSNNVVYGIIEDSKNNLWFSTENGLSRFNPETNRFEVYNSGNGLNFNNFSENTCIVTNDGRIAFGGVQGVEIVDPKKIYHPHWQNEIIITDFLLFNERVPIGEGSPLQKSISYTSNITLKHYQSSFSFAFSAMDFLFPGKTKYAYKLENFDQEWNFVTNDKRAIYTNLSPGQYIFRVKATNRDGEWASYNSISILILPPWYKTHWAFMIYSLVLVLLLLAGFAIVSKITRYRNELKIERRVNEMKLQFFTNISHEIRTPLTLIIGPIEDLLRDEQVGASHKQKLDIIYRNSKRMLQLTNQLLDFRKLQNNSMRLKIKEFDLVTFTREIYECFIPLAKHKKIDYNFDSSIPKAPVWADPAKIDTIIYNLISNALKFTDVSKKVTVSIRDNKTDDRLEIIVADEGRGIAGENLSKIFEHYTILSGEELAGTGIGLALSRELVVLHHGKIKVESKEREGSTFIVSLKKGNEHFLAEEKVVWIGDSLEMEHPSSVEINNDTPCTVVTTTGFNTENDSKALVMVVEDNHEVREYICQSLNPDFATWQASNGKEALSLLETASPDLVISDIMMPGMNGIELTRQLKENFSTSHIPVILLTSKSSIDDQVAGLETGADAYITKPFNSEYIKTAAKNLINQRRKLIAKFRDKLAIDPDKIKVNSKDEEFMKKLVAYVENSYSEDFAIDQLAEELCVSRTVLYNKVKGLTGLSPVEFVRQIKLKIAAHLLTQGFNVSEAAIKVGFSDARYFSKQFKLLFGHLPSQHVK